MNTFYNYEYAAAEVFHVPVERIFEKTRKDGMPFVRQMLIYYRISELKKSQQESAQRYGLDHSTAHWAFHKIDFFISKYPDVKEKYEELVSKSEQHFFDSIHDKSLRISSLLIQAVDLSHVGGHSFDAHEKRMLKLAECEKEFKEFKKLISSRWKEA